MSFYCLKKIEFVKGHVDTPDVCLSFMKNSVTFCVEIKQRRHVEKQDMSDFSFIPPTSVVPIPTPTNQQSPFTDLQDRGNIS